MREALLPGLQAILASYDEHIDSVEARRDTVLRCNTPAADPGCGVTVRWLYQVARANPPEQVFAQIMLGFMLAQREPRVVGFNLVQPEDNPVAMSEYSRQMQMIAYLRGFYPGVRFSLHAGELAPGLVPPDGLRSHIREAVEVAGASRVGHGVGVLYEDRPYELIAEMARRGVMVEINLTSNAVILGVSGRDHPLPAYMAAAVPVALSTDDEGVARSEITMEYLRAVRDQGLGYPALKAMARNSLAHSFAAPDVKAALQRDLERGFAAFEAKWGAMPMPRPVPASR
jgi:adenosine deaminase